MALNYKLKDQGVIRLSDGAHIPDNLANRDWREYQFWLADGNIPLPTDPPPPVDKTSPLTNQEIEELIIAGALNAGVVTAKKNART